MRTEQNRKELAYANLYLTIMAGGIGTGIEEQIEDFLSDYPET